MPKILAKDFGDIDAAVVCRQLGWYSGRSYQNAHFGTGCWTNLWQFVAELCHPRGLLHVSMPAALRKWADMDGRCELYGHRGINK